MIGWHKEGLRDRRIELLEDVDSAQRMIEAIEQELDRRGIAYA